MRQNSNKFKRFAIVDIGSVAIRSEIYSINMHASSFTWDLSYSKSYLPKLGNLDENDNISKESLEVAQKNLEEIKNKFSELGFDELRVVGTAVFRQSKNAGAVAKLFEEILGAKLHILSENEEARLIALGIERCESDLTDSYLLLDIGGRSSEVTFVNKSIIEKSTSFPIGAISVRNYFNENMPIEREIIESERLIKEVLNPHILGFTQKSTLLIGSSGTLRMISRFYNELTKKNMPIPCTFVDHVLNILLKDPESKESRKLLSLEKNRQELVYSGLLLTREFCRALKNTQIIVSNYSLRHGVLWELFASTAHPKKIEI